MHVAGVQYHVAPGTFSLFSSLLLSDYLLSCLCQVPGGAAELKDGGLMKITGEFDSEVDLLTFTGFAHCDLVNWT